MILARGHRVVALPPGHCMEDTMLEQDPIFDEFGDYLVKEDSRAEYTSIEEVKADVMAGKYDKVEPMLEHNEESGALTVNGKFIGEFKDGTIHLNAGWCRLAGIGIKVDADPEKDKRRVVFERPVTDHRLASGA